MMPSSGTGPLTETPTHPQCSQCSAVPNYRESTHKLLCREEDTWVPCTAGYMCVILLIYFVYFRNPGMIWCLFFVNLEMDLILGEIIYATVPPVRPEANEPRSCPA